MKKKQDAVKEIQSGWSVRNNNGFVEVMANDGNDAPICTLHERGSLSGNLSSLMETGRLLSASPELLQACKALLEIFKGDYDSEPCLMSPGEYEAYERALSAVNKAQANA